MSITPIGQLDYRLPQAGRIRTGEKVKARNGKMIPKALDRFRFTSGERELVEFVAERYGGAVRTFDVQGSGDRWMVDTEADSIDVIVPVPKGYSLAYELWNPHLVRRCNGTRAEVLEETPDDAQIVERDCLCVRRGVLECDMKLRVGLLLPGMPTLGIWRWDTNSENAVKEVRGVFKALHDWVGAGLHPCKMRLETRRQPGKVFKVVVLDPGISIESLVAGDARLVQLPTPSSPAVGELEAGASSVTHPTSTPEAGEPMYATGGAGEDGAAAVSPASPSKESGWWDENPANRAPLDATTDDDIVDAEIVEEPILHIDEAACLSWLERRTAGEKNRLLPEARRLAIELSLPVPTNWKTIPVAVIDRLMKAGDDEHARVRTESD